MLLHQIQDPLRHLGKREDRPASDRPGRFQQPARRRPASKPPTGGFHHGGALEPVDRDVLPGPKHFTQVTGPRLVGVCPGLHAVLIPAELGYRKLTAPPVVDERRHGRLRPVPSNGLPVAKDARYLVVALGKDVGFDHHRLSHSTLRRKAPPSTSGVMPSMATRGETGISIWGFAEFTTGARVAIDATWY